MTFAVLQMLKQFHTHQMIELHYQFISFLLRWQRPAILWLHHYIDVDGFRYNATTILEGNNVFPDLHGA